MSRIATRVILLITAATLAACATTTAPTANDCGGGSGVGSGNHC